MRFLYIMAYYFSSEAILQEIDKNNSIEINRCKHLGNIDTCARAKTQRRENVKFIVTNCKDIIKS